VVKAGDIVRVKVMEVDVQRKRIGLSMRLGDTPGEQAEGRGNKKARDAGKARQPNNKTQPYPKRKPRASGKAEKPAKSGEGTFAQLFEQARDRKGGRL